MLVAMLVLLAIDLVLLLGALGWLVTRIVPMRRAVRLRNAFLLREGAQNDFTWTPVRVPGDFAVERAAAPAYITRAVVDAGVLNAKADWDRALALVTMLVRHSRREGAVGSSLEATLRGIESGSGYCVDYVRVYLAAAHAVGMFCRQWAFSFDGFGGHGHTFVEIFDREHSRWAFIDVHNNVYATRVDESTPLGALELRRALTDAPHSISFRAAGPGRLGYPEVDKLVDYYRRGAQQWYLWWGNDVVTREASGISGTLGRISGRLGYLFASAMGARPRLVVLVTPENCGEVARLIALRRRTAAVALAVLGLVLGLAMLLGIDAAGERRV